MPRKECYDQKHKALEEEVDRLRRHIELQAAELNTLRTFNREYEDFVSKIRRDIRAVSKEMYLGIEERHGATDSDLKAMRDILDPYGLIMAGVIR